MLSAMKSKILLICSVILAGALPASAQFASFDCAKGKKISASRASEISAQLQGAYQGVSDFEARFEQQSYLAAMDSSELSSGTVWFKKPGKMKWQYILPEEQVFLVAGDTFWFYQKAENQVVIDRFGNVLISEVPLSFLTGLGDLERDFLVQGGCERTTGTVLDLIPRQLQNKGDEESGKGGLRGLKLLVDRKTRFPRGAEVTDSVGNITAIIFLEVKENSGVAGELFNPIFPKDADVSDRRVEER